MLVMIRCFNSEEHVTKVETGQYKMCVYSTISRLLQSGTDQTNFVWPSLVTMAHLTDHGAPLTDHGAPL